MKDRMLRFSALLLVLWYCFSVIGFDVHTCRASGKAFVATFVSGLSCADIHPEHKCDKAHCHHNKTGHCCSMEHHDCCKGTFFEAESCCSSDHLVLTVTGTASDSESRDIHPIVSDIEIPSYSGHLTASVTSKILNHSYVIDYGLFAQGDIQPLLSIWRI